MEKSLIVAKYGVTYGASKSGLSSTNNPAALANGAIGVYVVRNASDKPELLDSGETPFIQGGGGGYTTSVPKIFIAQGTATGFRSTNEIPGASATSYKALNYSHGNAMTVFAGNVGSGTNTIDTSGNSTSEYILHITDNKQLVEPHTRVTSVVEKLSLTQLQIVTKSAGLANASPLNNFAKVEVVGSGDTSAAATGTATGLTLTYNSPFIVATGGTQTNVVAGDTIKLGDTFHTVKAVTTVTNTGDTIELLYPYKGQSISAAGTGQPISTTGDGTTVVMTFAAPHGLKVGFSVNVSSVTQSAWDGVQVITAVTSYTASFLDSGTTAGVTDVVLSIDDNTLQRTSVVPTYVGIRVTGINSTTKDGAEDPNQAVAIAVEGSYVYSTGTVITAGTVFTPEVNPTIKLAALEQEMLAYDGYEAKHLIERFTQPTWYVDSALTYSVLAIGWTNNFNTNQPIGYHVESLGDQILFERNASETITAQATIVRGILDAYFGSIPVKLPVAISFYA